MLYVGQSAVLNLVYPAKVFNTFFCGLKTIFHRNLSSCRVSPAGLEAAEGASATAAAAVVAAAKVAAAQNCLSVGLSVRVA